MRILPFLTNYPDKTLLNIECNMNDVDIDLVVSRNVGTKNPARNRVNKLVRREGLKSYK